MEPRFEVGDTVVCVGESTGHNDSDPGYAGGGWKKGLEFEVQRVDSHGIHAEEKGPIYRLEGGRGVFGNWLELADQHVESWRDRLK